MVNNLSSGYYENPADGLVSDIRSQTDKFSARKVLFTSWRKPKTIIDFTNVDDICSGARILARSTTVSKSSTFTDLSLKLVELCH